MSDGDILNDEDPIEGAPVKSRNLPLPSNNPLTNMLIADIVLRGASTLLRRKVQGEVAKASADDPQEAREALDSRGMLRTLGLYGASRLATRSVPGLAIVTGGLVAKTLYDRGKALQKRRKQQKLASDEE